MELDTKAYLDSVCAMLKDGSTAVPFPVKGSSMVPFFREGDTVYLDSVPPKLHVGDIVLYTRASGDYILHRIVSVSSNGRFTILGDAQLMKNAENVSGKCIKAIVRRLAGAENIKLLPHFHGKRFLLYCRIRQG